MPTPPPLKIPDIGSWSGEFLEAGLEEQFRLATVSEVARQIGLVSVVGGGFYLSGFWVDYVTLGFNKASCLLLGVRLLFAALAIGLGWGSRRLSDPKLIDARAFIVLMGCVVATLFIILQTPVPTLRHSLTVFVFVIVFFVFVPTRIWITTVSSGVYSLAFIALAWASGNTPYPVMTMIIIYLVMGNILGWFAAVHMQRLRRLQWYNLRAERQARSRLVDEVQERKQAEESLRHLASGVAHNFNNSLMAVTSNIQAAQGVLNKDGDASPARTFLNNALRSAATGREVAQRLSRAVVGETGPRRSSGLVEVGELISQAKSIAWLTWTRPEQNLAFSHEIEPQLWVMANQGELMEVFQNILKNSLEALGRAGRIRVRARRVGRGIQVDFSDNGPGIAPDIQSRLFKPFASDKGVRGQGLGLAVSKSIINGLGGDITFQTAVGRGTTITVELPAAETPAKAARSQAVSPAPQQGRGKRVLLVEDEGLVALGVSAFLGQEGYQVWQARDLAEAMDKLNQAQPEVVICDFGLPDGNASDIQEAARQWAARSGGSEPVLIVLSGWSEEQVARDITMRDFKFFAWLQKPVDKQELLQAMRLAADQSPRFRATEAG